MATSRDIHPWIVFPKPNPQARLRLFCFPYAGGGASIFRAWADELPKQIEICAIQPPGRENRFSEPRFTQLPALVAALDTAVDPFLQEMPFAFFGHSLGALTSFELTRVLRRRQGPLPSQMLVAAHRAPQLPDRNLRFHNLSDDIFMRELRRLNGTPADVANNADLMEVVMPLLRADFGIAESYHYEEEAPLPVPISAFGGIQDEDVNEMEMAAWRTQSSGAFNLHMLSGDHFFLSTNRPALLQSLTQDLRRFIVE